MSPALPKELELGDLDQGWIATLLAEGTLRRDRWAERAAVALARYWTAEGRSVLLVDGDVETPSLHDVLRIPNLEGLSDVLLFGASPERVSVEVEGEGFRFIPAGTVVADPAGFPESERWSHFLSGVRERREVGILFLPSGGGGAELLAARGDRVVRLGPAGLPPLEGLESAVLLRPSGAAAAASAGSGAVGEKGPQPSGGKGSVAASGSKASSAGPRPAGSKPRPRKGAGRRTTLWVLLLILVLAVVGFVASWLGFLNLPGSF